MHYFKKLLILTAALFATLAFSSCDNDKTKNLKANKPFAIEDNVLTVNLSKGETTELIN
jgi:hypothetical protein